ncbi:MAG TPA: ABC transporter substrate-binding protein [Anaerolineales bacterium]
MPGVSLGDRYLLQEQIGQGGVGTVWRGFDSVLERPVAIKLLNSEGLRPEGRDRMLAEARAIARLDHPNIVSVYDAGESNGSPFIVMELVEGQNLHDRPPGDLRQAVQVAGQVCAALDHAHAQGIVHRDLKPENVVIGRDGIARLMDFGIARSMASRVTQEGHIVGTVFYLAPEQALGQEFDGRADLYSLGIMLYELTTGELPFTHDDPVAVISQHLHAVPVPPRAKNENIPPALNKLILALMSKDPAARPASAAEVGRSLASPTLLDEQAAPGDEPTVLERIARGRLVGREQEIGQARALWMKARAGEAQTLLIGGEPGVGKSRLLREVLTQVELTGGRALGAACYAEAAVPYAAFRQILREVFREGGAGIPEFPQVVQEDLVALLPELGRHYSQVTPRPPGDPQADQARLFESILILFSELCLREPMLIYLDDAHWADGGTLSMLRYLVRNSQGLRLMAAITYREQELDQSLPFNEVLLDLERDLRTTSVRLEPLRRSQTGELLAAIFQEEITEEFLEGIYRETEGNPFFTEEVCKALVESGKLYFRDGHWHRPAMEELGIPRNVRVAVQSRINKLPEHSREVLKQAAVLGRKVELKTLLLAAELAEDQLLTALEEAERAQLIEPSGNGGGPAWSFAHALIPSTMAEGLRIMERRRLHQRAAVALERTHPEAFGRLARHLLEAGELARGMSYLLQAGNEARQLHAYQEAIRCYRQAIDYFLEAGDDRSASSVLFRLGLTYHNAFEFDDSRAAYDQAFVLLQRASSARETMNAPPAPHALRLAWNDPRTLDSTRSADAHSHLVIYQLFRGLIEERPDTGLVPDIAESWEVSEGGRKYIFHLQRDACWNDGEALTAEDFAFAWKRCLEPGGGSPLAPLLYDIRGARLYHQGESPGKNELGIHAADPHTLLVELDEPANYFLSILATPVSFPVPRKVVRAHGDAWTEPEHIVTNGPFRLTSWAKGESMSLERWQGFHGAFPGNAERLEIKLYPTDASGLLADYEQDRLDIFTLTDTPIEQHELARQRFAEEYVSIPVLSTWFVQFDFRRPPFDDRRVRLALAQAADRQLLADVALRGLQFPATGSLVPPGMPGHSREPVLPHDSEAARRLLAEAGFPGGRGFPVLRLRAPSNWMASNVAEALVGQWQVTLGIPLGVEALNWQAYMTSMVEDPPQVSLAGWWADYPDPYNFLYMEGISWWLGNPWRHERYDRLVQNARGTADREKRVDYYRQAERILAEEVPLFPLLYGRMHFLLKPWISSFPTSPLKYWFFKEVVIEPH